MHQAVCRTLLPKNVPGTFSTSGRVKRDFPVRREDSLTPLMFNFMQRQNITLVRTVIVSQVAYRLLILPQSPSQVSGYEYVGGRTACHDALPHPAATTATAVAFNRSNLPLRLVVNYIERIMQSGARMRLAERAGRPRWQQGASRVGLPQALPAGRN